MAKENPFWKPVKPNKNIKPTRLFGYTVNPSPRPNFIMKPRIPTPVTPVKLSLYPKRTMNEVKLIDRNPWGDADRDKVHNYFDCRPLNRYKQDKMSPIRKTLTKKEAGLIRGVIETQKRVMEKPSSAKKMMKEIMEANLRIEKPKVKEKRIQYKQEWDEVMREVLAERKIQKEVEHVKERLLIEGRKAARAAAHKERMKEENKKREEIMKRREERDAIEREKELKREEKYEKRRKELEETINKEQQKTEDFLKKIIEYEQQPRLTAAERREKEYNDVMEENRKIKEESERLTPEQEKEVETFAEGSAQDILDIL